MRRLAVSATLSILLMLFALSEASACSVRPFSLELRCGTEWLTLHQQDRPVIPAADTSGVFERMSQACGESSAELEQFFANRRTGTFIRWSPEEEQTFRAIPNQARFSECYYQDYERVGNWLRPFVSKREYCFSSTSVCARTTPSPTQYLLFLVAGRNVGNFVILVPLALIAMCVACYLLLWRRRMWRRSLLRRFAHLFTAVVALCSILWSQHLFMDFSDAPAPLLLDSFALGTAMYVALGIVIHFLHAIFSRDLDVRVPESM